MRFHYLIFIPFIAIEITATVVQVEKTLVRVSDLNITDGDMLVARATGLFLEGVGRCIKSCGQPVASACSSILEHIEAETGQICASSGYIYKYHQSGCNIAWSATYAKTRSCITPLSLHQIATDVWLACDWGGGLRNDLNIGGCYSFNGVGTGVCVWGETPSCAIPSSK